MKERPEIAFRGPLALHRIKYIFIHKTPTT
jgi:hypothetical protein